MPKWWRRSAVWIGEDFGVSDVSILRYQDAERAIVKANPPKPIGERGQGRKKNHVVSNNVISEPESVVKPQAIREMRQAHNNLSDEAYNQRKKEAVENQEPLTRKALKNKPKQSISNPGYRNTGEVEWYTPVDILDRVRKVLGGIDLDPASCEDANVYVEGATYYSIEEDGLKQS